MKRRAAVSQRSRRGAVQRSRRGAVLAAVCFAACSARAPESVSLPHTDAGELLARVRANEESIRSLRAHFQSRSRHAGQTREAEGVLIVSKPERFRMRLMLPFGMTVFDCVGREDGTWISLPLNDDRAPLPADLAFFSRENLGAAFLRGSYAFPGTCSVSRADERGADVICRGGGDAEITRTLRLDRRDATLREESTIDHGTPRLVIRYEDYRRVANVLVPFRIALSDPGRDLSVEISIEGYEVNPSLTDDLFAVPPGARALSAQAERR